MVQVPEPVSSLGEFLAGLEAVPWFSRIGCPTPAHAGVERMFAWRQWPGPEDPAVAELAFRHQDWHDRIMVEAADQCDALRELWDRIHAAVEQRAGHTVPFDPARDAWHAPTTAVVQAAWTAELIGLCLQAGRPVPPELQEQWAWFACGHWPSAFASVRGEFGPLLVY